MGERSYAYAKACGILGRSFLPGRMVVLESLSRLSDLDHLLFPDNPQQLPERSLSVSLERRIAQRSIERSVSILCSFMDPPPVLIQILLSTEVADMKAILSSLASGETSPPRVRSIPRWGTLKVSRWPDLQAMVAGTDFEWVHVCTGDGERMEMETELDRRYYTRLWKEASGLEREDRDALQTLLFEEVSLKNLVWAVRLKGYYRMEKDRIGKHSVIIDWDGRRSTELAVKAADLPFDRREAWKGTALRSLLNPEALGNWRLDPRSVQNRAALRIYRLCRKTFRSYPFSLSSLAAFMKLLQTEEDILTSTCEALSLGLPPSEVLAPLEASR